MYFLWIYWVYLKSVEKGTTVIVIVVSENDGYSFMGDFKKKKLLQEKNIILLPSRKKSNQVIPSGRTASNTGYDQSNVNFLLFSRSKGGDSLFLGIEMVTIRAPKDESWVLYANSINFFPLEKWLKSHLFFFFFLRLHLQHMEVPGLGVSSELQLPPNATTAKPDMSCVCDLSHICVLHCTLWQHWMLEP